MSKKIKRTPPAPPFYRVIDINTGRAVFASEDFELTKQETIRRKLAMEAYEWGFYQDEYHPKGMWFHIHLDYKEPSEA